MSTTGAALLLNCFKVPSDIDSAICGTFTIVSAALVRQHSFLARQSSSDPFFGEYC